MQRASECEQDVRLVLQKGSAGDGDRGRVRGNRALGSGETRLRGQRLRQQIYFLCHCIVACRSVWTETFISLVSLTHVARGYVDLRRLRVTSTSFAEEQAGLVVTVVVILVATRIQCVNPQTLVKVGTQWTCWSGSNFTSHKTLVEHSIHTSTWERPVYVHVHA